MRLAHLVTLSLALLLGACGFQLRGTGSFDFAIKEFRFKASDSLAPLAKNLQESLKNQGITLTDSAEYSLYLGHEALSQRQVSFTAGTRTGESMLTSSVLYEIRSGDLPALISGRAEVQRVMSFNHSHAAASNEENNLLREEMRRELVNQLLLRLQALKPEQLEQLRVKAQARADADKAASDSEQQRLQQQENMFQLN
ncbi:MAG: hypothetical protein KIG85_08000 [Thiopseudomonas sp.]|nr:hypothetical protein [Thiopseudomonas sp.]